LPKKTDDQIIDQTVKQHRGMII